MSQSLVIFDLDHTLFKKNASVAFGAYLYRQGEFSFVKMLWLLHLYALHKCRLMSLQALHKTIFMQLFYGKSSYKFQDYLQKFLMDHMENLLDSIVLEKLHQVQGSSTALLSSSPDFLVEAIAKKLHIPFWMGSAYAVNENGIFSSIRHVVNGLDKALKVKELSKFLNITNNNITAYTDSYLDIPLLEEVGEPIAVNPDKKLLKKCKELSWDILWTK